MHQERNLSTVSQLLTQIQDFQNKVNSLSDAREFYDPESGSSSGATHVPVDPLLFRVTGPSLAAILDCRMIHGILWVLQETLLIDFLPEKDEPTIFNDSKNLASSSLKLGRDAEGNIKRPEIEMRREPQNSSIPPRRFQRGAAVYDHTGGTYSHSCVIDFPRFPISELHLGKLPDPAEFQSWKVSFKTEVCSKTAHPHLTMHWIKEVEIAKSIDEPMTSRSIVVRNDFSDCDMLDAIAKYVCFRKRVSFEEQRAQNTTDSWEGDKLLAWSTSISVQPELLKRYKDPHSDFYRMTMSKISTFDGMKLFFFSASDLPSDVILEG